MCKTNEYPQSAIFTFYIERGTWTNNHISQMTLVMKRSLTKRQESIYQLRFIYGEIWSLTFGVCVCERAQPRSLYTAQCILLECDVQHRIASHSSESKTLEMYVKYGFYYIKIDDANG